MIVHDKVSKKLILHHSLTPSCRLDYWSLPLLGTVIKHVHILTNEIVVLTSNAT